LQISNLVTTVTITIIITVRVTRIDGVRLRVDVVAEAAGVIDLVVAASRRKPML
jgi:hypothetical protein